MKHSCAIILAILFITAAQAQQLNRDTVKVNKSYSYYMQKRNTNNTIGWVCVGSGLTLAALGLLVDVGSAYNHGSGKKGDGIAVAGEIVALASIPFFIIAHHNKKKASLYVSKGAVTINKCPLYKTNFTSLSLAIHF